jgi:rSAM/selenodomain-associated transferase 1
VPVVEGPKPKLVILTKPVRVGLGKTRLAPELGEHRVAELVRAFIVDTYQGALGLVNVRVIIALSEPGPLPELEPPPEVWEQGPGDLGERMGRVARRALSSGEPWVILIGSDAPGLPKARLEEAASALDRGHPAVLGPARDGGYYLLGLRSCEEGLLSNLSWSTETTLDETRLRLQAHGMTPYLTGEWFDVDRPEDLRRLTREIRRGTIDAPATRRALALRNP